jgi:hypothetical protein
MGNPGPVTFAGHGGAIDQGRQAGDALVQAIVLSIPGEEKLKTGIPGLGVTRVAVRHDARHFFIPYD